MHVQKWWSFGRWKSLLECVGNFQESGLWLGTVNENQCNAFLMTVLFVIL